MSEGLRLMSLPDRAHSRSINGNTDPSYSDSSNCVGGAAARYTDFVATFGLCAVIALAPLPFGSTDARVVGLWVVLLSAVLLLASLPGINSRDLAFLSGFAAVSLTWAFVVSEQLSQTLLLSSQLTAPIWDQASALLGDRINGSVSTARNQPFFSAGSQIACLLSMLCGYLIGRNRRDAYLLLNFFLGSALIYAIEGIIAFAFWPNFLLWQQKYNYLNSVTATFINPNVAATYFGAATVGWILVAASLRQERAGEPPLPWRELIRSHLHATSPRKIFYLLACFVMLTATMLTGSRAGSVLSLLALAGALTISFRRELRRLRLLWALPTAIALLVVATVSLLAPRASQRFGVQGFFDLGRWYAYDSTIGIIKDFPWLGSGLGTFKWIFPAYRSGNIPSYGIWEQAHNTTLEIAAEMGIPFAVVVAIGWASVLLVLGLGMLRRDRDAALPTAAFWIGLLAIVHSQVDFPLQIPGFSLAVCPILGMGMAQSFSSRSKLLT
ncbi:O-antigen ligase family protein [Bradyrhizobium xenonodulans]|uniref:O-antigen ligase family protein n=1 Tax=Bradyrhizobium xenonodulans TaxID=2736875 RepID=A0ABY7MPJ3_9BRAD|nr:O-antigen ligase family protein [Bradyrhizobium xenonodulans]WBL80302.1 O-antigen ligase family protein [Bradyrhizobium xenonodulans]